MSTNKEYNLIEAIEAVGSEIDPMIDIVTVKMVGPSAAPIVRVYIDHPDGVSFDILCNAQKWIGEILDKVNPFSGSYTLEVSSPGPERPLRKKEHFLAAIGKQAKIKTINKIEDRKVFSGTIEKVEDNVIEILLDEGKKKDQLRYKIPLEFVISANLKADENW